MVRTLQSELSALQLTQYIAPFQALDLDLDTLYQSSSLDWEMIRQHTELSLGNMLKLRQHLRTVAAASSSSSSPTHRPPAYDSYTSPLQFDQYIVQNVIGRGHFGTAYTVRIKQGQQFVLKVIHCKGDTQQLQTAEREARTLTRIPIHTHLLTLCDFFRWDGNFCMLLPWCEGGTLQDRLVDLTPPDLFVILRGCAQALCALHRHTPPIIHRDIKPDNLFFRSACPSSVVIGDMGLSRTLWEHTYYASSFGHIQYKAPEIVRNRVVPASDVWSLGVVLLCMIRQCTREHEETMPLMLGMSSSKEVHTYLNKTKASHPTRCSPVLWTALYRMLAWKHRRRPDASQIIRDISLKLPAIKTKNTLRNKVTAEGI